METYNWATSNSDVADPTFRAITALNSAYKLMGEPENSVEGAAILEHLKDALFNLEEAIATYEQEASN